MGSRFYLVDLVADAFSKIMEETPKTKALDEAAWQGFSKLWLKPSIVFRILHHIQKLEDKIEELEEQLAEK